MFSHPKSSACLRITDCASLPARNARDAHLPATWKLRAGPQYAMLVLDLRAKSGKQF